MSFSTDGRRIEGTDIGTGHHVYQVGKTGFSNKKKYDEGYDNIKWNRDADDGDSD